MPQFVGIIVFSIIRCHREQAITGPGAKMRLFILIALALASSVATAQIPTAVTVTPKDDALDNAAVISLSKAGLGPEAIIAKINSSRGNFDTSTQSLIQLKGAGVPDGVIAAMLNRSGARTLSSNIADNASADPLTPHTPGVYMLDPTGAGRMVRIDATVSNQIKTANSLGFAFSYGLSSMKLKSVIPNATARSKATNRQPTFYFYFNQSSPTAAYAEFGSAFSLTSTSPNEFSLIRFDQKKDHREAALGSYSIGGAKTGVDDKARVEFTYDEVAPGVFRVMPNGQLEPGQYGFVGSAGAGAMGYGARIFDFSVN